MDLRCPTHFVTCTLHVLRIPTPADLSFHVGMSSTDSQARSIKHLAHLSTSMWRRCACQTWPGSTFARSPESPRRRRRAAPPPPAPDDLQAARSGGTHNMRQSPCHEPRRSDASWQTPLGRPCQTLRASPGSRSAPTRAHDRSRGYPSAGMRGGKCLGAPGSRRYDARM